MLKFFRSQYRIGSRSSDVVPKVTMSECATSFVGVYAVSSLAWPITVRSTVASAVPTPMKRILLGIAYFEL